MKKMLLVVTLLVCLCVNGFAAIWTEDFTGQDGKGLSGTTALGVITNMSGITNWTVGGGAGLNTDTSLNWWQVTNGAFQGQDVGVSPADWQSKDIDVSAESTVTISMDLLQVGIGCNTVLEYFKIFYKLDGGTEQLLLYVSMTNQAAYTGTTFNSPAIDVSSASTLNILTRLSADGANSGWQFDNVQLVAGAVGPSTNVQFIGSLASVSESSVSYTVTVYKTQAGGDVSGQVSLGGTATIGGGADYTVDTTNFTMIGSTTSATFVVTINDDADPELAETVILTLANVVGGIISTPSVFTLTIEANDFPTLPEPTVWINEINYDPAGTDAGEFVEVAGPSSMDLSTYQIVLYNGNGGGTYGTTNLSGTIDDEGCGYGAAAFVYPVNGLQNGAPDGLALAQVSGGVTTLVQFLSYEGVMVATNGPAAGRTSVDIGTQNDLAPTLQLGGTATNYSGFAWETNTASEGSLNANQNITGCLAGPQTNVQFTASSASAAESSVSYTVTVYKTLAGGDVSGQVSLSGTAAEGGGADYTIDTTNFTMNGATTSAVFIVTINEDGSVEPAETVILTIANVVGGIISTPSAFTLTITDNDVAPLTGNEIAAFRFNFPPYLPVSTNAPFITVSVMALSSGTIETNVTAGAYFPDEPYIEETGGWTADNQAAAKNFFFTITPDVGHALSISGISFRAYSSSAGPSALSYDIAGGLATFTVNAPDSALLVVSQDVAGVENQSAAVTVMIQGWTNGSRATAGTGILKLDDVVIYGTITATGGNPDTDGDGMADAWELLHFGTLTNAAGGNNDSDVDNNYEEYVADTDPTNGSSFFVYEVTNMTGIGTMQLLVGPPTTNSRIYDAFFNTNLISGPWTPYNFNVPGAANGSALILTVTNDAAERFYRTGVKVP